MLKDEKITKQFQTSDSDQRQIRITLLVLVLLFIIASGIMLAATPYGSGLIGDSFYYISGARTIAAGYGMGRIAGDGEFSPTTKYPPMFSLLLAGGELIGIDAIEGARWLNAILFGLSVFLAGIALLKTTRSLGFSIFGALLIAVSPGMISVYSWAMSEPLYIALSIAGLLLLHQFFVVRKWFYLLFSAFVIAAAFLTRYIGGSLVLAAAAILLLDSKANFRKKIKNIVLFCGVSMAPVLAWFYRNYSLTRNLANRRTDFTPIPRKLLSDGAMTVWSWLLPQEKYSDERFILFSGIVLVSIIAMAVLLYPRIKLSWKDKAWTSSIPFILLVYIFCYAVSLFISLQLFDPTTPLNERILSPVHILFIVLIIAGMERIWRVSGRILHIGVVFAAMLLFWYYSSTGWVLMKELDANGQGYTNAAFKNSELFAAVRDLPDVPIYTNNMVGVYFVSGRNSYTVPQANGTDEKSLAAYAIEADKIKAVIRQKKGVLVLRDVENMDKHQIPVDILTSGLTRTHQFSDGEIYEYIP
jgi:hypothetical protein